MNNFLNKEYNSCNNKFLTNQELKDKLLKDGWLKRISVKELEKYNKEELLDYFRLEGWQL